MVRRRGPFFLVLGSPGGAPTGSHGRAGRGGARNGAGGLAGAPGRRGRADGARRRGAARESGRRGTGPAAGPSGRRQGRRRPARPFPGPSRLGGDLRAGRGLRTGSCSRSARRRKPRRCSRGRWSSRRVRPPPRSGGPARWRWWTPPARRLRPTIWPSAAREALCFAGESSRHSSRSWRTSPPATTPRAGSPYAASWYSCRPTATSKPSDWPTRSRRRDSPPRRRGRSNSACRSTTLRPSWRSRCARCACASRTASPPTPIAPPPGSSRSFGVSPPAPEKAGAPSGAAPARWRGGAARWVPWPGPWPKRRGPSSRKFSDRFATSWAISRGRWPRRAQRSTGRRATPRSGGG